MSRHFATYRPYKSAFWDYSDKYEVKKLPYNRNREYRISILPLKNKITPYSVHFPNQNTFEKITSASLQVFYSGIIPKE